MDGCLPWRRRQQQCCAQRPPDPGAAPARRAAAASQPTPSERPAPSYQQPTRDAVAGWEKRSPAMGGTKKQAKRVVELVELAFPPPSPVPERRPTAQVAAGSGTRHNLPAAPNRRVRCSLAGEGVADPLAEPSGRSGSAASGRGPQGAEPGHVGPGATGPATGEGAAARGGRGGRGKRAEREGGDGRGTRQESARGGWRGAREPGGGWEEAGCLVYMCVAYVRQAGKAGKVAAVGQAG